MGYSAMTTNTVRFPNAKPKACSEMANYNMYGQAIEPAPHTYTTQGEAHESVLCHVDAATLAHP